MFKTKAQAITCDAFCITEVRMDTSAPNLMNVTLLFTGGNNDFINYPWIAEVIDAQGDTVGVGTWNFFGQFGNTSTDYPVMVQFDTIPDNFNATMVFHYDTSVCLLSFPCTMTGIEESNKAQQISIYPNPFSSETKIYSEKFLHDLNLNIFDLQGQLVKQIEHLSGHEISLQRDDLVMGIYFVQLVEGKRVMEMRRVIVE
ncbi:MAG: T9SS type A sorting domain-containing protein [Saprospiraceae bacterium]|uniref:T9SS type A sorting domain-containing protein n=1 Tax=Candidatus Opimibacter skivensis TaxID=2982028 RepID=A0A9D7XN94_9BACT|nr:T9SS type A sorting domain-containing protein [Candidatus Opimibacter skivensis]